MLFSLSLLLKHDIYLWFLYRFILIFRITLFNSLFTVLECHWSLLCWRLIPSLLPPSSRYLDVSCAGNEGQPMAHDACALTSLTWDTRTSFLLSPSPQPSSKPVPTHHANIRAVVISNSHPVTPSATNQTSSCALSLDWVFIAQQAAFPWPRSDPANDIYHLTDLRLKGYVIFHQKKYSEQNLINEN